MRTIKEYDPTDYYFLLKSVIDSRLLFSTKKIHCRAYRLFFLDLKTYQGHHHKTIPGKKHL